MDAINTEQSVSLSAGNGTNAVSVRLDAGHRERRLRLSGTSGKIHEGSLGSLFTPASHASGDGGGARGGVTS